MTREEKEQTDKYVLQMARSLEDGCYQQEILLKAVHIIDEALEQEPIIDKIRAEIVELWRNEPCAIAEGCLDEILEIIDKYKAEKEQE